MSQNSKTALRATLQSQFSIIVSFLAIFWLLEILDAFVFRGSLDQFGIYPRSLEGLRGIVFAPFLHADFGHLIANSVPFVVLAWLVMLQEVSDFWIVTIITMVVGGLGVWLIAPPNTVTVGASILIFGYLGFLLFRGWFQKKPGFHCPFYRCPSSLRQCPLGTIAWSGGGFLAGSFIWLHRWSDRRLVNC